MNLKKVEQRTAYNAEKRNKAQNFELLNTKYCKKGQTVLAGDSITELYNLELFGEYSEKTGKLVYNRGISGDTSNRLLERFESTVLNLEPANIVLLIGTNDLAVGASANYIIENVEKIIRLSREKCPGVNIILEAVYPVNNIITGQNGRSNGAIKTLNRGLEGLAAMQNVEFIDLTDEFADKFGFLKKKYTYDGLHVNALAYEVVTAAILPYLK